MTSLASSSPWLSMSAPQTRRAWLQSTAQMSLLLELPTGLGQRPQGGRAQSWRLPKSLGSTTRLGEREAEGPGAQLTAWATRAVEVAHAAGASYADARFTRTVQHTYNVGLGGDLDEEMELIGAGVRVLVHGYWGFVACPLWIGDPAGAETVVWLARSAVAQAQTNAQGTPRATELGTVSAVTGTWTTPIQIDPFTISLEEKQATLSDWVDLAARSRLSIQPGSYLRFIRQERVLATSDGTRICQTCYSSGGMINVRGGERENGDTELPLQGIDLAGQGWERFLEANIPDQLVALPELLQQRAMLLRTAQPSLIGRYPLVCDGATMASLTERTWGMATQLDRALGYEANSGGTSLLTDPLAMLGRVQVTSPLVTVTANRSAPAQLATVQWDEEGVVPDTFPLIQDGVLVDFQTTREQAAWLAPYYEQHGRPVRSHGCAAAQDATYITMQHMPNLALVPHAGGGGITELVADVQDGLFLEGCEVLDVDFQAQTGLLGGGLMRKIQRGKLSHVEAGGVVRFNTLDIWKHVTALGNATTEQSGAMSPTAAVPYMYRLKWEGELPHQYPYQYKGQPVQSVDHSVRAVAATIANQPLIIAEGGV